MKKLIILLFMLVLFGETHCSTNAWAEDVEDSLRHDDAERFMQLIPDVMSSVLHIVESEQHINPIAHFVSCYHTAPKIFDAVVAHPRFNKEQTNQHGLTPLLMATLQMNSHAVARLLEHDVNINAQDQDGLSAIHYLVMHDIKRGCHSANCFKIFNMLLRAGVALDLRLYDGKQTPIVFALRKKRRAWIKRLVVCGAPIQQTPVLHHFVKTYDKEWVVIALLLGADPLYAIKVKKLDEIISITARDMAAAQDNIEMLELIDSYLATRPTGAPSS